MTNDLGEVYVENESGEVEAVMASPWAVDSNGDFIETSYKVTEDGEITQTIDYDGENYPLTADPLFCRDTINNTSSYMSDSNTFKTVPRMCTRLYGINFWLPRMNLYGNLAKFAEMPIVKDGWSEARNDYHYKKGIKSKYASRLRDQYICHAFNPLAMPKSSWNLDTNRPDVSLFRTYIPKKGNMCNPSY